MAYQTLVLALSSIQPDPAYLILPSCDASARIEKRGTKTTNGKVVFKNECLILKFSKPKRSRRIDLISFRGKCTHTKPNREKVAKRI